MVDRVKSHMYTEANVKHIVCPDCKGSGSILIIDLMDRHLAPKRYKRELVNGRYAEVCGRCRGLGWLHKQLLSSDGIEEGEK